MKDYLASNKDYWEKGYTAPNVESFVFRFYGRVLKPEFDLGRGYENLVDFGCGQGATVNFFTKQGFNARGVDISRTDIEIAKIRYPHLATHFDVCDPDPSNNDFYGFPKDVSVVTAIQSLYYFSNTDFDICMEKIHRSMRKGGVFYATMMGVGQKQFFNNSEEYQDGLRRVSFKTSRYEVKDYYISFTNDKSHLLERFKMFKPVHIGFYAQKFREDEEEGFHYTFCGIKE